MFKNTLVALAIVVIAGTSFAATPASALSFGDLEAQIERLKEQVRDLTAQLSRLRGSQTSSDPTTSTSGTSASPVSHRICGLLNRNMGWGARGDDVQALQEFLYEQKYLTVSPTGYFGGMTVEAVRKWQAKEGVAQVGAIGPLSRERLKAWCGGTVSSERFSASPTRGNAPLMVTFETWLSGFRVPSVSYMIDFGDGYSESAAHCPAPADACTGPGKNTHTYTQNGSYTATLNKITDPCPDDGDPSTPRCMAAIQSEVVATQQIVIGPVACTKEYKPVCGAKPIVCVTTPCDPIPTTYGNRCEMNADGASFLYEGQCRSENPADDPQCKVWFDGCNSCARNAPGEPAACTLKYCATPGKAYCTARFSDSGNKPPVISGFSGPTSLTEDASGTWTVNARDPEGGSLSYQVWWGDENVYAPSYTTAAEAKSFTQTTSFSHAYANPGTYTVQVTVRDSAGGEAKTSASVRVTSGSSGGGTVCTADAYQCPNGEWVGRTGPYCQFVCN